MTKLVRDNARCNSNSGRSILKPASGPLHAMVEHPALPKVAAVTGIACDTLSLWMRDPAFRMALFQARQDAYWRVLGALQQASPEAAQVIADLIVDPQAPCAAASGQPWPASGAPKTLSPRPLRSAASTSWNKVSRSN